MAEGWQNRIEAGWWYSSSSRQYIHQNQFPQHKRHIRAYKPISIESWGTSKGRIYLQMERMWVIAFAFDNQLCHRRIVNRHNELT
jgi:hypothetical protein